MVVLGPAAFGPLRSQLKTLLKQSEITNKVLTGEPGCL
jgi:hypothetical protein